MKKSQEIRPDHRPHQCIPFEDAFPGTLYTFNFNPKYQPDRSGSNKLFYNPLGDWLNAHVKLFDKLRFCIIYAVPEMSSTGRLHYHGTIKMVDVGQFYLYDLHLLSVEGMFEIDTIKDDMVWDLYIHKCRDKMSRLCQLSNNNYVYKSGVAKDEAKHKRL